MNETIATGFSKYELSGETLETLSLLGYLAPTPIQEQVIPLLLEGKHVVGKSQTGSGKTAAFGIPVCDSIRWEENSPQALILEPTRELAVQVKDELFQIGRKRRIKIPVIFGGMPIDKELLSLKQKSHIVVGTPGRVMDHIRRGSLVFNQIHYLIIDEADLMLDMGFLNEVEEIIKEVNKESNKEGNKESNIEPGKEVSISRAAGGVQRQKIMALFSATLGEHLQALTDQYLSDAVHVEIAAETETVETITQYAYEVEKEDKCKLLLQLLMRENPEECMIFCDTREMVNSLYQQLKRKRIRCGMLHGGMEQRDRLYSIGDFRQGKFHIFITTDVAARGIDFPDITHVINYDFPTKRENYVHRIGRTGRNGKSGIAISLIQPEEQHARREAEVYCRMTIPTREVEELSDFLPTESKASFLSRQKERIVIKEGKGAVFHDSIMKLTIGGGKKSKMRPGDIVGAVCAIEGLTGEDIGIIDVRDSLTYLEIMNGKGQKVLQALQKKPIKGKLRKVQKSR